MRAEGHRSMSWLNEIFAKGAVEKDQNKLFN